MRNKSNNLIIIGCDQKQALKLDCFTANEQYFSYYSGREQVKIYVKTI